MSIVYEGGYKYITRNCELLEAYHDTTSNVFVELWYCEEKKIFYVVLKDPNGVHIRSTRSYWSAKSLYDATMNRIALSPITE